VEYASRHSDPTQQNSMSMLVHLAADIVGRGKNVSYRHTPMRHSQMGV
jgi:hypothetical protein